MDFKILPSFPSSPEFSACHEVITNRWPLARRPEEINPEGIPCLFRVEEIREVSAEPIAWPCDDATSRWITEDGDESFPSAPEKPETNQTFEF